MNATPLILHGVNVKNSAAQDDALAAGLPVGP